LTLGILAACGGSGERAPVVNLVERLPLATLRSETTLLDLGTTLARPHLVSGWSYNEKTSEGETFVWANGEESEIRFVVIWLRDMTLRLRSRPYQRGGVPTGDLTVSVNGQLIERIELARGDARDYSLGLPAGILREGENRLTLRQAIDPGTVADRPHRGGRPLTSAWFRIRFGEVESVPTAGPRAALGGRALFLPWGSSIDFHLQLAPESGLYLAALRARGEGRLEVVTRTDDRPEESMATLSPGEEPIELALNGNRPEIARLILRAKPSEESPPVDDSGLLLVEPGIQAPRIGPVGPGAVAEKRSRRPNIIVYLVDTLRADHLGCYGQPKPISPRIDDFSREAALFEHTVANSSWTRPAVASLFTGLWPRSHNTIGGRGKLSPDATTLAEVLQVAGYRTASVVTNPNVSAAFGLDQGFEYYRFESRLSDWVNEEARRWLDSYWDGAPFFLYLHTKDPHDPYDPPAEYRRRFAPGVPPDLPTRPDAETPPHRASDYLALYAADVAFNDDQFGRLLDSLRERGLYDDALIVFVSDHGEEFQEHGGWQHGKTLHAEQVNVPLIVKLPGQRKGSRIPELTQQIDLMPTILDYLGLEPQPGLEGRSLLGLIEGETPPAGAREPIFSYLGLGGLWRTSVVAGRWKLIQRRPRRQLASNSLFDTRADPGELRDLAELNPVTVGYLATLIQERLLRPGRLRAEDAILAPELEAELQALGYLP